MPELKKRELKKKRSIDVETSTWVESGELAKVHLNITRNELIRQLLEGFNEEYRKKPKPNLNQKRLI